MITFVAGLIEHSDEKSKLGVSDQELWVHIR